ncbi:hypothetical protein NP233_g1983 [Leucocoprinus birnbaumii]|uniref:Uncharacterized protein n=1 Tax=Leucocoprinus birnbaumii TaxID=56174 RepID=A0AAD5VZM4_9AGAR|nr:hypothetical protein NP233_g1983 [Leucocoprinus birnbaumii]
MDSFELFANFTSFLDTNSPSSATENGSDGCDAMSPTIPRYSFSTGKPWKAEEGDEELSALGLVDGERTRSNIAGLCIIA